MSATSQPVPFSWKQVDERLSTIMQGKISAEIRELITDDIGHIRFQNMHNENSIAIPSQRMRMQLLRSDEWAARRTVQYMLESAPAGLAAKRAAWEVITAKARIRTLEAGIASIEAGAKWPKALGFLAEKIKAR